VNGGFEYRETIGREASGSTVLAWLAARHRHSSESLWRARIGAGELSLDGALATASDVLASRGDRALVAVRIPTGRPHQIRIHLAVAGHPLVGDPLYVTGGVPGPQPGLPGDGGYRLHAYRLALAHPATGDLECAPPRELRVP